MGNGVDDAPPTQANSGYSGTVIKRASSLSAVNSRS